MSFSIQRWQAGAPEGWFSRQIHGPVRNPFSSGPTAAWE